MQGTGTPGAISVGGAAEQCARRTRLEPVATHHQTDRRVAGVRESQQRLFRNRRRSRPAKSPGSIHHPASQPPLSVAGRAGQSATTRTSDDGTGAPAQ